MAEINKLWVASYLHEMLGAYLDSQTVQGEHSRLYEETLMAAGIMEAGLEQCDVHFLAFMADHPDSKAASLYQVLRRFPDSAVRGGAVLMIERLTSTHCEKDFLQLRTGVMPDKHPNGHVCTPISQMPPAGQREAKAEIDRMSIGMRTVNAAEFMRPPQGHVIRRVIG